MSKTLRYYMLNEAGEPVPCSDVLEWGRWFETADAARSLARTKAGKVDISTVFLGLDHNFGAGPPLLWETMVFGGEMDGDCDRHSSRAEAIAGHAKMFFRVMDTPAVGE